MSEPRLRRQDEGGRRRYVVIRIVDDCVVEESKPLRKTAAVNRLVKTGMHSTDAWDRVGWADNHEQHGWIYRMEEVSAGAYRATGRDQSGRTVQRTGSDPEALLDQCRRDAAAISHSDG